MEWNAAAADAFQLKRDGVWGTECRSCLCIGRTFMNRNAVTFAARVTDKLSK